jgi:hypothetical protein
MTGMPVPDGIRYRLAHYPHDRLLPYRIDRCHGTGTVVDLDVNLDVTRDRLCRPLEICFKGQLLIGCQSGDGTAGLRQGPLGRHLHLLVPFRLASHSG